MNTKEILDRTILLAVAGSRAYGMANEASDYDYRGVCIPTSEYLFRLKAFDQKDKGWGDVPEQYKYLDEGTAIYNIVKYVSLCKDNNPNIIEQLYYDDYVILTPQGRKLVEMRDMFLSKRAGYSFSGYAMSQIRRLERHRSWLLDPPTSAPDPVDFGLGKHDVLSVSQMNAFLVFLHTILLKRKDYFEERDMIEDSLKQSIDEVDFLGVLKQAGLEEQDVAYAGGITKSSPEFIQMVQKNNEYKKAVSKWKSYQTWKENRNPRRAEMEAKCGYDSKHASQCIRLLKVCLEILDGKGVIVDRRKAGDAEELLAIKNGNVPYDILIEQAIALEKLAAENTKTCALQKTCQHNNIDNAIDEMLLDTIRNDNKRFVSGSQVLKEYGVDKP